MKETDLYEPVRAYLARHGYEISAEVKHCDIAATRGDDLIVVELKTSANMNLLIQATERQQITGGVYVAIPDPKRNRRFRGVRRVLRRLELGLLVVTSSALGPEVRKIFDPLPTQKQQRSKKRQAIIQEIADRSGMRGGRRQKRKIDKHRRRRWSRPLTGGHRASAAHA